MEAKYRSWSHNNTVITTPIPVYIISKLIRDNDPEVYEVV